MLVPDTLEAFIRENVGAPMATLGNTPGAGNPVPAQQSATTGVQFTSDTTTGSGDRWDNSSHDEDEKKKKKKKKGNTRKSKNKEVKESLVPRLFK